MLGTWLVLGKGGGGVYLWKMRERLKLCQSSFGVVLEFIIATMRCQSRLSNESVGLSSRAVRKVELVIVKQICSQGMARHCG
jgi:hypothetical protein